MKRAMPFALWVLVALAGTAAAPAARGYDAFTSLSVDDISTAALTSNAIPASLLSKGTVFLVRTTAGRYSKVRIDNYASTLTIRWNTYETWGSIRSQGANRLLHGSMAFDLDMGLETNAVAASADIQWDVTLWPTNVAIEPIHGCQCCPFNPIWEGAMDLDGGWRYYSWFGLFFTGSYPWIWHVQHGWMAPSGASVSDFWLWTFDMGWLWTSDSTAPWMYRLNDAVWLYYLPGSSGPRWFYNAGTSAWEAHSP